jgi:ribosomal protein L39E
MFYLFVDDTHRDPILKKYNCEYQPRGTSASLAKLKKKKYKVPIELTMRTEELAINFQRRRSWRFIPQHWQTAAWMWFRR